MEITRGVTLDLSSSRKGGSPLNRGCLGRRSSDLTSLLSMSILNYGYRLSRGGRSLNRNSMRGCRGGKRCKLSPTKKALSCVCPWEQRPRKEKGGRKYEDQNNLLFFFFFLRMRKTKVYGRLVSKETYLQFRLIEHNRISGRHILFMLRLQRKRGTRDRVKERSQQVCQFRPQRKVKRICSLEGQGKS